MIQELDERVFMEAGLTAHNSGDLEKAEANYRNALALNPYNPDALHLLGYLAFQLGFADQAISLIEDAIKISPKEPLFYNKLASIFQAVGETDNAIAAYKKSISIRKDDSDVLNDLANLLRESALTDLNAKTLKEAERLVRKAIKLDPKRAQYHNNLGNILRDLNPLNLTKAKASYQRALKLSPDLSGVTSNLGLVAEMEGDLDEAEIFYKKAVEQDSENPETLNNYAQLLAKKKKLDEAICYYEKAEKLAPENYSIGLNKARCLMNICRNEDAMEEFQKLMELDDSRVEAFWNFATTLRKIGKLNEALEFSRTALEHFPKNLNLRHEIASIQLVTGHVYETEEILEGILGEVKEGEKLVGGSGIYATLAVAYLYERSPKEVLDMFQLAVDVDPDDMNSNINYAMALLSLGMLEAGWKIFKNRFDADEFTSPVRPFQKPAWEGQPLEGKTIAIWGEQGIGDEIRHASLIPDFMNENGSIIIECAPRLVSLFERSFEGTKIVARLEDLSVPFEEECDYQLPILDLASFYRPTIESFPQQPVAYLKPDPDRVAFWRGRLDELGTNPKVGFLWRGILETHDQTPHYATVDDIQPVMSVQGVDFVNLMYAESSKDRARILDEYGVVVHDWGDIDLKDDQDDLAALVSNLDLVISPLTATGNLAGALAVPVFTFMTKKRSPELLGYPDAPGWAASMRHFIKGYGETWEPTMAQITIEMKRLFGLP